jgi:DNA-binding response OmpR family regulator
MENDLNKSRIMLVDDDIDITTVLKIGLEDNGFAVDTFNDPVEALSNFKAGLYNLFLFDIKMPQLSGFELYEEIKKKNNNNNNKKLKVCYITAYEIDYKMLRERFPTSHVDCFIKKPFQMQDLVKRVRAELG